MTVGVPAREERGARSVVACPEQGARQPRGRDPPEPGAVPQLCPQGVPGSRADGSHPVPTRPGPSVTHPGWAGGLVPATATHQRRPTVSRTGKDSKSLGRTFLAVKTGPAWCTGSWGPWGGWGKDPVTDREGGRLPLRSATNRQEHGHSPGGRCQWPCFCTSSQPHSHARGGGHQPRPGHAARTPAGGPGLCGGGLGCRCPPPRASDP